MGFPTEQNLNSATEARVSNATNSNMNKNYNYYKCKCWVLLKKGKNLVGLDLV